MRSIALVVSVALLSLGVARAEDACRADVEKLCKGVRPGEGRVLVCLQANEAQLSPACKQQVGVIGAKAKEIGAACGDDVQQFCPNVKTGGGRILKCLVANSSNLSQMCQNMVKQAEEKSAEFKKACGDDVTKFCGSVPKGHGRILNCLQAKQAELAPACQALLKPLLAPAAAPAAAAAAAPAAAPAKDEPKK
jgi:Golgi apparatus protein 1